MVSCTGYTEAVAKGQSFPDFFKKCCQAFLFCYRDCPKDYPIEKAIDESKKALIARRKNIEKDRKNSVKEFEKVQTPESYVLKKFKAYVKSCSESESFKQDEKQEIAFFEDMLCKVKAYNLHPSLVNVQKFMVEQLEQTTKSSYRCDTASVHIMSFDEYKKNLFESVARSAVFYDEKKKEFEKEYPKSIAFLDALLAEVKRVSR